MVGEGGDDMVNVARRLKRKEPMTESERLRCVGRLGQYWSREVQGSEVFGCGWRCVEQEGRRLGGWAMTRRLPVGPRKPNPFNPQPLGAQLPIPSI